MNKLLLIFAFCPPLRHLELTSAYGCRLHPLTGRYRFHAGIDLRAHQDTVFAVLPGRITFAGYDAVTGEHIRLASGDFNFLYGHLSEVFVQVGDSVAACRPLGLTGSSGHATGEHLHFSVRYQQKPVNPLTFFRDLAR
ncbi:M23 family metallopeptidase [Mucilaginibacter endophyticus]|uniref:M23 family metallopeptidase n=1 Tax=Mucilaginibacter endophyticus TaxID=2675003 RepID=UPI000E0DD28A|nr:M23 family metallopeptidase [Mucilaginibacter endophyticus]